MWDYDNFKSFLATNPDNTLSGDVREVKGRDVFLRRARISYSGETKSNIAYNIHYNVSDSSLHKAYITLPIGEGMSFTVGKDGEPFMMEDLTSSKALTFLERNLFTDAITADKVTNFTMRFDGRLDKEDAKAGISIAYSNPDPSPLDEDGNDLYVTTVRAFYLPYFQDYNNLLHIGGALSTGRIEQDTLTNYLDLNPLGSPATQRYRHPNNPFVASNETLVGTEFYYVSNEFSLQAESFLRHLDPGTLYNSDGSVFIDSTGDSIDVYGSYIQATYTLTGESRGYSLKKGTPGMLKPNGSLAIEIAGRLETVSFSQASTLTGDDVESKAESTLLGLNFYFDDNVKLAFNYRWIDYDNLFLRDRFSSTEAVSARLQLAF